MLAVARGLMAEPEILIIDELSLGLALFLVLDLFQILKRLKAAGLTMLLVEQNVKMALAISDYTYVLAHGQVELEGPSHEVAKNEQVREAYLGI
jgi:branched-chain amino acid transport system ATP-binding protein